MHAPPQLVIQLATDYGQIEVLIEQQFDILHGIVRQRSLFQYCVSDSEFLPFIRECARQLVILIIKTGYSDVRYDNNPILSDGRGLALIDMDKDGSIGTGLVAGCTRTGTDGILYCLSPEMLDFIKPLLQDQLTDQQLSELQLDAIRGHLVEDAARNERFQGYLNRKGITTGREKVTLQGLFGFSNYIKELQQTINETISINPGLCLAAERKFYIYNYTSPAILNQLKAEGKIFDWMDVTARNPGFGFGYYVWC